MVPAQALVVPKYLTVADLPLIPHQPAERPARHLAAAVAKRLQLYLLKRFFDQIPRDVLEAAEIDGAGRCAPSGRSCCRCPVRSWESSRSSPWSPSEDFLWPLMVFLRHRQAAHQRGARPAVANIPLTVLIASMVIASIPRS